MATTFTDSPQDGRIDEAGPNHTLHLLTTASTPATPGPSTPTASSLPLSPLEKLEKITIKDHENDIVPPLRPMSTPFPEADMVEGDIQCSQRSNDADGLGLDHTALSIPAASSNATFRQLPGEIHECILDHIFGVRASTSSKNSTAGGSKALRRWGTALRHSRRREVAQLSLVTSKWRELIQERLYRHLKIKGTKESVDQASYWFHEHPNLCSYVKHIEIWFPVFQQKNPAFDRTHRTPSPDRSALIRSLALADNTNTNVTYQSPSNNCSLYEVFLFVRLTFATACILTLEGGDRKKPPMVRHFSKNTTSLPVLPQVRTLVCKGQWNLIRENGDFQNIAAALPSLQEWHGSYARPKSKAYISMSTIVPNLPQFLTHLNICIEADYRREAVSPLFVKKVKAKAHLCAGLAKALPTLEHLAFTGRICGCFFDQGARLSDPRESRLKSIDLIVKNVCRPTFIWNDGSGITDMSFILAFESLVLAGVKSLERLKALDYLRIRFLDLVQIPLVQTNEFRFPSPSLNPYFQLKNNQCTGIWSDTILNELAHTRPRASFLDRAEYLGDIGFKDGQLLAPSTFSKTKPLSIKVSSYSSLNSGITIS
ncbi:hypothetical protein LAWI1_G006636 [Lachnellula willkommii]|uniref:Uncharacterized protein n=1 Tax=Lachnellula willkommii TaxID=215461 RepID=A0A559M4T8_9HELO|nr:hypothetical protein LAWI1_G006636 [Lachnellula willkommii]